MDPTRKLVHRIESWLGEYLSTLPSSNTEFWNALEEVHTRSNYVYDKLNSLAQELMKATKIDNMEGWRDRGIKGVEVGTLGWDEKDIEESRADLHHSEPEWSPDDPARETVVLQTIYSVYKIKPGAKLSYIRPSTSAVGRSLLVFGTEEGVRITVPWNEDTFKKIKSTPFLEQVGREAWGEPKTLEEIEKKDRKMSLAKIAKKLLDKGEVELAREVLAADEEDMYDRSVAGLIESLLGIISDNKKQLLGSPKGKQALAKAEALKNELIIFIGKDPTTYEESKRSTI